VPATDASAQAKERQDGNHDDNQAHNVKNAAHIVFLS